MEMVMSNNFSELSMNEMEAIDGGKWYHVVGGIVGGVIGGVGGFCTDAIAGGAAGSAIPVLGTSAGAWLGGIGGSLTGIVAGANAGVNIADKWAS